MANRYSVKLGDIHLVSDRPIDDADRQRAADHLAHAGVAEVRFDHRKGIVYVAVPLDSIPKSR